MSTHNLCSEQKYEKYQSFLSENFKIPIAIVADNTLKCLLFFKKMLGRQAIGLHYLHGNINTYYALN